jgi:fructoselysine 6-kinase
MTAPRIAAVGEVAEDVYLPDGEGHLGGISCNFARAAMRAGARAALYAAVGDDERGARVRGALAAIDLAELRLRVLPGATARQHVRVAADGERVFCGFDAGVLGEYRLSDAELAELTGYEAVAVPCSPESAAVFAQCLGLPPSVRLVADFSQDSLADIESVLRQHGERLAVAFVGATTAAQEPLARLAADTGLLVVLTAGAAGAYALGPGPALHQPSVARSIVDTTGCGDAFQGAFTASWLRGAPLAESLRAGAELAALIASRRGAGA